MIIVDLFEVRADGTTVVYQADIGVGGIYNIYKVSVFGGGRLMDCIYNKHNIDIKK